MKPVDLENIFTNDIYPSILHFEQERKKIIIKLNISWLLFFLLAPSVFFINIDMLEKTLALTLLFLTHIFFRWYYKIFIISLDNFYVELKTKIIKSLIKAMKVEVAYEPGKYLGSRLFKSSKITDSNPSRTSGHDLITFTRKDAKIYFSFVKAIERTSIGREGIRHYAGPRLHNFIKFNGGILYCSSKNEKLIESIRINFSSWEIKSNKEGVFVFKNHNNSFLKPTIYKSFRNYNMFREDICLISDVLSLKD